MKCDNDIKKDLFKNIVLAGGCTMFEGMQGRMSGRALRLKVAALQTSKAPLDGTMSPPRAYLDLQRKP